MNDRLKEMYLQQEQFMHLLQQKRTFPQFPVDLKSKTGQKFLKTIFYECSDELHEARQHLKQKDHRLADITEVNMSEYLEEISDVFHYLFEIVIASGISVDDLFDAYIKKGEINTKRIEGDY